MTKQLNEAMADIPLDIIPNILSRLPVKSLVQFKLVSKTWLALISSPQFAKLQLDQASLSDENSLLLITSPFRLLDYESPSSFEDVEGNDDAVVYLGNPDEEGIPADEDAQIVDSCNGLVCCFYDQDPRDLIILWNPTIKASRKLPPPPTPRPFSQATFLYRFGYVSSTNDYKVLRVLCTDPTAPREARAEVFSLNDNAWRVVEGLNNNAIPMAHGDSPAFVNGAIHWVTVSSGREGERNDVIVSFDLVKEKFGEVPMPYLANRSDVWFHSVGVLQGCLSLLCCRSEDWFDLEVWVMKEYGNGDSWTPLCVLRGEEVLLPHNAMRPVCFTKNGEIIIDLDSERLVRHNIHERTMRVLKTRFQNNYFFEWAVYTPSLVSPNTYCTI